MNGEEKKRRLFHRFPPADPRIGLEGGAQEGVGAEAVCARRGGTDGAASRARSLVSRAESKGTGRERAAGQPAWP